MCVCVYVYIIVGVFVCVSRQHLILHTARINGYSKVMMGDSCTRLAIKLLTNVSLGRGAALAADTVSAHTQTN